MMKKLIGIMLCIGFAAVLGFARGNTQNTTASGGNVTEIVWQYPSPGDLGSGFQDMENALNAMMERDIGVRVRFEPAGLMETQQKAILMVSAGEQLDISMTAFTSIGPLVDSGLILPLDDLLVKFGQDIINQCGTLLDSCTYGGNRYGVPPAYTKGNAYGYMIRDDMLKKYGLSVDDQKLYTLAEVESIFEKVKAGEGQNFYTTVPWNTEETPLNNSYIAYDKLTGSLSGGVLMLNRSFSNLTVTNLFETDEYKQYAEMMYRWGQRGYISSDAAVTTEIPDNLLKTGRYLGMMYWYHYPKTLLSDIMSSLGMEMSFLKLVDPYIANNGGYDIMWHIPITTGDQEKAMQALNYIYKNKEAAWLVQLGIEGKSYEIVEDTPDGKVYKYLAEDPSQLPYYNPYGLWGNRLEWPVAYPAPSNFNKLLKAEDDAIPRSRYSPALGYNFVQQAVINEITAVNSVVAQYTPGFNSGALNPQTALPEFIAALKAAGIDRVIAENQRQLNAWAAAKR
jgi:putative aldouronate transport system substrate-binding protein